MSAAAAALERGDPWAKHRRDDPVLRAVVRVLAAHPEVAYDTVDWRPFIFGRASCPAEQRDLDRGLRQDPDAICGSQSIPYDQGGGGYLERFAQDLGAEAEASGEAVSTVILEKLREGYRREVESRSPEGARRAHWAPMEPIRSFEAMLAEAGWNAEVLAEIDDAVAAERGAQDDREIEVRGGQLDLFAATGAP